MDLPKKPHRTSTGPVVAGVIVAVLAAGVAGYLWGNAPSAMLEEQLQRARDDAAASASKQTEEQSDDETQLDAVRVLMVERLAEIEGRSRVLAARIAAGSYLLGSVEMCEDFLGENHPRCDNVIEALTRPAYPGDPGYVPEPADEDITSIAEEFEPLLNGLCSRDAWPYRLSTEEFQRVKEACKSYGTMVGEVIFEG